MARGRRNGVRDVRVIVLIHGLLVLLILVLFVFVVPFLGLFLQDW